MHWSCFLSRRSGPHAKPVPRPVPKGEYPPGVRYHTGEPNSEKASPFVQVHLPPGYVWNGKKSHAVSYVGPVCLAPGYTSYQTAGWKLKDVFLAGHGPGGKVWVLKTSIRHAAIVKTWGSCPHRNVKGHVHLFRLPALGLASNHAAKRQRVS